jgi:hypothetical protein
MNRTDRLTLARTAVRIAGHLRRTYGVTVERLSVGPTGPLIRISQPPGDCIARIGDVRVEWRHCGGRSR